MRRVLLPVVLLAAVCMAGCGMMMNSDYADRLDNAVLWSAEKATKAEAGDLATTEMAQAVAENAERWRAFKDARGPWLGVSAVWMNAGYTRVLDKTVAWTADMARRASAGELDDGQLKHVLRSTARFWRLFADGRKGVAPEGEGK
ncbi:MAG TPA: hypothetical protein VMY35_10510 [Phycisphaerae bacterium]|nr:hypothetical protein [Phycisphaerae bacterium]